MEINNGLGDHLTTKLLRCRTTHVPIHIHAASIRLLSSLASQPYQNNRCSVTKYRAVRRSTVLQTLRLKGFSHLLAIDPNVNMNPISAYS
jgi:hypothetical protein